MDKAIIFNTSVGTLNMGDYIINESCKKELSEIVKNKFLIELSTHIPVIHCYQSTKLNKLIKYTNSAKYKFLTGTNILAYNMFRPWPNWNVNIFNFRPYKGTVLIGAGQNPNGKKLNLYTKMLYKNILSKEYYHSTRDEKTKQVLEELGFKAINTGCATLWGFTKEFCKEIPKNKSKDVVFTLTDYCKDYEKDQQLIDILLKNYNNIYFWIQGSEDYEYLKEFKNIENIKIIGSSLEEYKNVLQQENIEFVGTRLHAGIYAMQHKKRSIIIQIDNRTKDMKETYNLNVIERSNILELESYINSSITTDININEKEINEWKTQFIKK